MNEAARPDPRNKFLAERSIAVVGVSRNSGYGKKAFRHLKSKGYRVYPLNRETTWVEGQACYSRLDDLPEQVWAVVIVVPPAETGKVVEDCIRLGVKHVWMQPGAQSPIACQRARDSGISVVDDACILLM